MSKFGTAAPRHKSSKVSGQSVSITDVIVYLSRYFLENVERITQPDYMNKEEYTAEDKAQYQEDVLRSRVRTSGIVTEQYIIAGRRFEMYDVGGQRNERRKCQQPYYTAALS